MASYASLSELKQYLPQIAATTEYDALLQAVLDRATSIINLELALPSNLTAAALGSRDAYGNGTAYLSLPENGTLVTLVTAPTGYTVPSHAVVGKMLIVKDATTGILASTYRYGLSSVYQDFGYSNVWQRNLPYTVAATYGYSADVMTAAKEACLQIAVRLFRFRDSGGSEVVGTDAGVVVVRSQFSPFVKSIFDAIERAARGNSVGVF